MNRFTHVRPELRETLFKSNGARIRAMAKPLSLAYPAEETIRRRLHRMMVRTEQPKRQNLVIVGNAVNGKTRILHRLYDDHGIPFVNQHNEPVKPVIVSRRPENASPKALYEVGREWFRYSGEPGQSTDQGIMMLTLMLAYCHTRLLIVDGVDDYDGKNVTQDRTFLSTLLRMGDDRKIPVVLVGRLSAVRLLDTIGHRAETFDMVTLPKWHDDDDLKRFLDEAESHLPLKEASQLSGDESRTKLLRASGGRIGAIDWILRACCRKAIENRGEQITPRVLDSIIRDFHNGGSSLAQQSLCDQRYGKATGPANP